MISEHVFDHISVFKTKNQIIDGVQFLIHSFGLENDNLTEFAFRDDEKPNYIVLTTEGEIGEPQLLRFPRNILNFDLSLILVLIAHEMLHVRQKTQHPFVTDKNEREWQAYCEMLFHTHFPQIPDAPDFNQKQFCEKALEYYKRMGEGSELQQKYADEKALVEKKLLDLSAVPSYIPKP